MECRFRWAVCQLNALQACPNLTTLRKALRSLPKTLGETYSRILCNIPDEYSDYAVTILRWLAYAKLPMHLVELGELIAVNLSGDPWFDPDIRFPDPRDLLDIFPGLLQIEGNKLENMVIRLAHFSVKEYLISERIKTQKPHRFWLPEIESHDFIAAACLAYLLHVEHEDHLFLTGLSYKLRQNYPLAIYACWRWTEHTQIAGSLSDTLKDLILEFLRRSGLRKGWLQIFHIGKLPHSSVKELEYVSPLFTAASIGIVRIVQILVESGHDVNERCDWGTALETAATHGHDSVLRILLVNGADPNLLGPDDHLPLQLAARFGTLESVKALRDSGADMHDERGSYGSPLIAACVYSPRGSSGEKSAEFLLAKGVNVHISSKECGNALHAACAQPSANIALIKNLLSKGMDIDEHGGKYGTALQAACAHSRNDLVIRFLLSKANPCIEVENSKYRTALQAICAESHDNDKVVKLLLDHGAKKTVRGGKYGTVLHAACHQGNEKVIRLLLKDQRPLEKVSADQYLDVNKTTARYGTPLHFLCGRWLYHEPKAKIVRLLVELGADINASDDIIGTPLHAACVGKDRKFVHLLIELGADINANNAGLGTPLHVACKHWCGSKGMEEVIRLLVEKGADISSNDAELGTALHVALSEQDTETAKLLIAKGIDVNIQKSRPPYTALEILLQDRYLRKNKEILCMLYEHGVVETGLLRLDAIRLEKMKKQVGISTDREVIEQGGNTISETVSSETSGP